MRSLIPLQRLLGAVAVVPAVLIFVPFTPPISARGDEKPNRAPCAETRPVSYLREVRPILAQHCFQCHGPDEAARKGKLRLDLKEHAFAERKGGRAIAPGDPGGSLVWERIISEKTDERMPPEGAQPLTQKQIDTLKRWIEQGAKWEEHW